MLVPVSGDARSLRALELAVLLAKASGGKVTALHVRPGRGRRPAGETESGPSAEAIFAHVRDIGQHFEMDVKTVLETGRSPGLSILAEARRGRHNLIVLGVGRRAGEGLSFGAVPDTLLETSDRSLIFFASS
jgi:nucleotide-binding universal stress UspA family protein